MSTMRSSSPARRTALFAVVTLMAATSVSSPAVTYYLAVDVPSNLSGTNFTTHQVVRSVGAVYGLQLALPAGTEVAALHRRTDGTWLFSPEHHVTLGATTFAPRDVVAYDGVTFSMALDGSAIGVPVYARIDGLFQHPVSGLVLSFDVPVNLSGTEYSRSDLVAYSGGFSLYWSAAAAGVPVSSNVVGAALDGAGLLVVTFDVPTQVGAIVFMPGQLVGWSGGALSSYFVDAGWPRASKLRDFAFAPAAGTVPDGTFIPGTPLEVNHAAGGQITLKWSPSCSGSDTDYEIYEGKIGAYYSHAAKLCSTAGVTSSTFLPGLADSYYLVVPTNSISEGGYGFDSLGVSQPPGAGACLAQAVQMPCP